MFYFNSSPLIIKNKINVLYVVITKLAIVEEIHADLFILITVSFGHYFWAARVWPSYKALLYNFIRCFRVTS